MSNNCSFLVFVTTDAPSGLRSKQCRRIVAIPKEEIMMMTTKMTMTDKEGCDNGKVRIKWKKMRKIAMRVMEVINCAQKLRLVVVEGNSGARKEILMRYPEVLWNIYVSWNFGCCQNYFKIHVSCPFRTLNNYFKSPLVRSLKDSFKIVGFCPF